MDSISQSIKKVCIYGPESVGKTTLAEKLAEDFGTNFVPEMARSIITSNRFTLNDIISIGHMQTEMIFLSEPTANKILFCDTDLITTQIYSNLYFNFIPPILYELEQKVKYDAYLFLDIDVPWVADNLRNFGTRRSEMMEIFIHELEKRNISFTMISGNFIERFNAAKEVVTKLLN
ncbi:AAA family ATPase [Fibrella sp. WM1]|uniref:AAA family ATPase n=1 Tax=Fibrella musci TaxID=3242485 RepID=UPI003522971A